MAEFPEKTLSRTKRKRRFPGPATDIAPPLAALQLVKVQSDTARLLAVADTAPPVELVLRQF